VPFEEAAPTRGVDLPIVVLGPLGGVEYWASDRRPLLLDCRLAVALHEIGPILRGHGVVRARFSGAYVLRTTRSGRPSRHARGLAIDVHDLATVDATFSVKQHFARNTPCAPDAPVLNRVACDLSSTQLFRELLTPDYDRDHHDHFHLAIADDPAPSGS
jgi:hypothetical protein